MSNFILEISTLASMMVSQTSLRIHRFFRHRLGLQVVLELMILLSLLNIALALFAGLMGDWSAWKSLYSLLGIGDEATSLGEVVFGQPIASHYDPIPLVVTLGCWGSGIDVLEWIRGKLTGARRAPGAPMDLRIAAWGIAFGVALQLLLTVLLMDYFNRGDASTLLYAFWPWIISYALLIREGGRGGRRSRHQARRHLSWLQLLRERVFGELAPQTVK